MGVDAAAVTSAEAAQYRAAGWWTDITLSECVAHNAASTPDKPAYVEFSLDAPDCALTWSEFDHAATNLAHQLLELGVAPGAGVAVWHKDTPAIHVLLVAIERCGAIAVGLGARAGVREVAAILRTTQPTLVVSDADRLAAARQAAEDADPALRVVAVGKDLDIDTTPRPDTLSSLSPVGPDDVFLINSTSGTTGLPKCVVHTQNRWHYFHQKAVANGELSGRRRVPPCHPHALRLRHLDLAHHADSPGRHGRQNRAVRRRRNLRGHRAPPGDRAVLRQHAAGDDPGQTRPRGSTT